MFLMLVSLFALMLFGKPADQDKFSPKHSLLFDHVTVYSPSRPVAFVFADQNLPLFLKNYSFAPRETNSRDFDLNDKVVDFSRKTDQRLVLQQKNWLSVKIFTSFIFHPPAEIFQNDDLPASG